MVTHISVRRFSFHSVSFSFVLYFFLYKRVNCRCWYRKKRYDKYIINVRVCVNGKTEWLLYPYEVSLGPWCRSIPNPECKRKIFQIVVIFPPTMFMLKYPEDRFMIHMEERYKNTKKKYV